MLAYYGLNEAQVPIVILKDHFDGQTNPPSDRIVQLITDHYGSESIAKNYLKIKVRPDCFKNGLPQELIVYRLFRDKYYYEADRLIVDETFAVIGEEKNIRI
ncbi:MAG: hypothetical protein M0036_13105 [Desulfobacteraceae bacterium]|nr:hypothetical protein [Desulfobacteraceae bacterium]